MTALTTTSNQAITTEIQPIPVEVGTIYLSNDNPCINSIDSLMAYCTDTLKLLSMIPDRDKLDATIEDDGIYISTDEQECLLLAFKVGMLDIFDTTIHTLIGCMDEEDSQEVIDGYIDHVLENHDFGIELLDDELVLKLGECKAAGRQNKVLKNLSSMPEGLAAAL